MDNYPSLDNYRLTRILNYGNSTDSEPSRFTEFEYDRDGNLLKKSYFDYPNTLYLFKEFEYKNNILKKESRYVGEVGNLKLGTYIQFEYDKGKLIKEELHLADGTLKYTTHYEFSGNRLVNTYQINDKLGIYHQYKYTYDNLDRLILEENYMYDQQLSQFTKYYYDDNNRLIKTEVFDRSETLIQTVEKKYIGSSKLPSEELYFDPNGVLRQKRQLLYDNLENLTEINFIDSRGIIPLLKKKYNGKLLIEEIGFGYSGLYVTPSSEYSELYVTRYEYSKI